MKRENGFYWVGERVNGQWRYQVVEHQRRYWYICGSDDSYYDNDKLFEYVSDRLMPPADAPR